ncbi:hypothetical protein PRECH8_09260 [Insulibacter thermoxylanivorax]|uniref:Copper amine oxidase N-terminal domain-containing protein n=1 Tax=Insulibacter thermoxylanivorax TaxID=2749268 RepID=A0A916QBD7_9BACL|nr:cell wall hydrolase [Insulibacter thermoxylanivorax]GFR37630.1 hypothetical protein PRECH8_09260 [Insulibacter thermoxylanivorax]
MLLTAAFVWPASVLAQAEQEEQAAAETIGDVEPKVYIDSEDHILNDQLLIEDGRLLVSIRHLAEALDGIVVWVQDQGEVRVFSVYGDVITFQPENPLMKLNDVEYRMDVAPISVNQRIYVPLRHAAQFLHAEVEWDEEDRAAYVLRKSPYILEEGETLAEVSAKLNIEEDLLLERNRHPEQDVDEIGHVKIVIPDIMRNKIEEPEEEAAAETLAAEELPYSESELELLAKITMVEAGYEPYEGQLAVANVILNRVRDPRFPDTIRDVIYAPNQFPPAHNGLLDKAEPNESVWKAVMAAARGENNVEGAVYFHNPKVSSDGLWNRLTEVARIGNHRFLK